MRAQHFAAELHRLGPADDEDRWAPTSEDENLNFETVTLAGLLRETLPRRELMGHFQRTSDGTAGTRGTARRD